MTKIKFGEFKIGDFAVLIHADGIHTLEIDKAYRIIDIKILNKEQTIALEGTELEYEYPYIGGKKPEYLYYNCRRFTDIKYLRGKKLQKIKNAL